MILSKILNTEGNKSTEKYASFLQWNCKMLRNLKGSNKWRATPIFSEKNLIFKEFFLPNWSTDLIQYLSNFQQVILKIMAGWFKNLSKNKKDLE